MNGSVMALALLKSNVERFSMENRKYIGSKTRLLPFIERHIQARAGDFDTLVDLFAGTGVVAHHFAAAGKAVVVNDNLYSNYVGLSAFLCFTPARIGPGRLERLVDWLNSLPPAPGYCAEHFGGTYFTVENAARIDAVREQIHSWQESGAITQYEAEVLLTSLLYAVDKVANTCGQYDAFLKHLGKDAFGDDGTHLVDVSAYKPLTLLVPDLQPMCAANRVFCRDANELAASLKGDVLYLDPPYNARQYVDNYHVLENIVAWKHPALLGKTKKFRRDHLKSAYSSRRAVGAALDSLLSLSPIRHIFLSYNSEGLLDHETLLSLLGRHGTVEVFEEEYGVFGNGAGQSRKRRVIERLYYCHKARRRAR